MTVTTATFLEIDHVDKVFQTSQGVYPALKNIREFQVYNDIIYSHLTKEFFHGQSSSILPQMQSF